MKKIRLYRHPDCAYCAKISNLHRRFDWLGRVELSADVPPTGPLRMGEIAVENLQTHEVLKGGFALRLLARQIPLYLGLLPLLYLPPVLRAMDARLSGCDGEACALPGNHRMA